MTLGERELQEIRLVAAAAVRLRAAVEMRDEEAAAEACRQVFQFNPNRLRSEACAEELSVRCEVHEAVDSALRGLWLADDAQGSFWRRLVLPDGLGTFEFAQWISNPLWLRMCGSELLDAEPEELDVARLADLGFAGQAKALGRLLVSSDSCRWIPYGELARRVDERLLPFLTNWLLCCYLQSPDHFALADALDHQRRATADFLELFRRIEPDLAIAPRAFGATYRHAYHVDEPASEMARAVSGGFVRHLFDRLRTAFREEGSEGFAGLADAEEALLTSYWREEHVVYRCTAPLFEGLRQRGCPALLIHQNLAALRPHLPAAWRPNVREVELRADVHSLPQLARVADELERARLDFLLFPEIGLSNDTTWLATQRLARVQATTYGHPVTSGSPHVDYFIGGSEVETDGAEYCEQLVLVPGLGVSTTTPPAPGAPRSRPVRDASVRVTSMATVQKLNVDLLRAWDAILEDSGDVLLDLFPAISLEQAQVDAPVIGAHLRHGRVDLHPKVERQELADVLVDSDVYLDSFPFGGFNTLVEVLAAGCPVVTLEGRHARNRFGAAMLRRLQLPEFLIAHDYAEYIAAARRLIRDAGLRAELREQLSDRDAVLDAFVDPDVAEHFTAAVAWMRERGPRSGARPGPPVLVRAGEAPRTLEARRRAS